MNRPLNKDALAEACPWDSLKQGITNSGRYKHDGWKFFLDDNQSINASIIGWFKSNGWQFHYLPSEFPGKQLAVIFPIEYENNPPSICFHTTPFANLEQIKKEGLTTGQKASQTTTGRPSAGWYIYVTGCLADAKKWRGCQLLGKVAKTDEWAIVEIDLKAADIRVFRDPWSETGLVLDTEIVDAKMLKHRDTFRNGKWDSELREP
jgi:hypothetical protein